MLIDTNVFVRARDQASPDHASCVEALERLHFGGTEAYICTQVWIEYWAVATRPLINNGLGLEPTDAEVELARMRTAFPMLSEPADIAELWRDVVTRYEVRGRQAHDARIVALMLGHDISTILTLNGSDFARYREISVLAPTDILLT